VNIVKVSHKFTFTFTCESTDKTTVPTTGISLSSHGCFLPAESRWIENWCSNTKQLLSSLHNCNLNLLCCSC